ncbi:MAG: mersacidin/lichenicidin family type 2 lantibiotic [Gemmataceae bacterium]|nr:mersacidin/lichenicidin family type 2 lantibiotic [Gemmataceae bacterium]
MSVEKIIRAWKDEDFRQSLSAAERALLPAHPAGLIDLTAAELDALTGGYFATPYCSENPTCEPTVC